MYTTLNKIREHSPCEDGWKKLLATLGKTKSDDEPLSILTVLDSNGQDDALWCLRAVDGHDMEIRLFVVWCARQVQPLMTDRSIRTLDVAERYAHGQASLDELAETGVDASAVRADAALTAALAAEAAEAAAAVHAAAGVAVAVRASALAAEAAADVRIAAWAAARDAQLVEFRKICITIMTRSIITDTLLTIALCAWLGTVIYVFLSI